MKKTLETIKLVAVSVGAAILLPVVITASLRNMATMPLIGVMNIITKLV